MRLDAKTRLSATAEEFEAPLKEGLQALHKIRPHGKINPHVNNQVYYSSAYFDYEFEAEGLELKAQIDVSCGESAGKGKGIYWSFNFNSFGLEGQKPRAFNAQADKGPWLNDLAELPESLSFWEGLIADGMKRYIAKGQK